MSRRLKAIKAALLQLPYAMLDRRRNARCSTAERRFLILRHAAKKPNFHDYFLRWLAQEIPAARARFELRLLPCPIGNWAEYAVCAPWLQDPAADWMPLPDWRRLMALERECDARGIPVLNRAEKLEHAVKSVGARLMAAAGVRTPRVVPVEEPRAFVRDLSGLEFPLIIREDRKHAAPTYLVRNLAELKAVPWSRIAAPVAAEFIDVRSPRDGLYRKYRYVIANGVGVPRHMLLSSAWEVRAPQRLSSKQARDEEIRYLESPDPNHATLEEVRRQLELEFIAFDYSYDLDGRLVVWESNPYPNLSYPTGENTEYTRPFVERSFAAIAAMYQIAAGEPLYPRIAQMLEGFLPGIARSDAAPPARVNDPLRRIAG